MEFHETTKISASQAEQDENTGSVLSGIAGIILLLGTIWMLVSAITGCTPYY